MSDALIRSHPIVSSVDDLVNSPASPHYGWISMATVGRPPPTINTPNNICLSSEMRFGRKMNDSEEEESESVVSITRDLRIVLIMLGLVIILVAIAGNTLVIVAVSTTRRLRSVTNCFVVSLAVADLLVGLLVMPVAVAKEIAGGWPLNRIACDLWISLDVLLCTASILNLCCISLDRYLAITRPLVYSARRSKRLALAMIGVVWVAATAITCPPIFGWYEEGRESRNGCHYIKDQGYVLYSSIGSFFLPLVVMIYVYTCIMRVIAKRERVLRRRRHRCQPVAETDLSDAAERRFDGPSTTTTTSESGPDAASTSSIYSPDREDSGSSSSGHAIDRPRTRRFLQPPPLKHPNGCLLTVASAHRAPSRRPRGERRGEQASYLREKKAATTLAVVVGGFVICWLPFFLVYVIKPFCGSKCYFGSLLLTGLTWLGWFNSAVNPFIYAFYNLDFRTAFWRLTVGKLRRQGPWNNPPLPQPRVEEPEPTSSSMGGGRVI